MLRQDWDSRLCSPLSNRSSLDLKGRQIPSESFSWPLGFRFQTAVPLGYRGSSSGVIGTAWVRDRPSSSTPRSGTLFTSLPKVLDHRPRESINTREICLQKFKVRVLVVLEKTLKSVDIYGIKTGRVKCFNTVHGSIRDPYITIYSVYTRDGSFLNVRSPSRFLR